MIEHNSLFALQGKIVWPPTLPHLLSTMSIPSERRDLTRFANVQWLLRNLGVRNSEHPHFKPAMLRLIEIAQYTIKENYK
jgi:hypothetical protein